MPPRKGASLVLITIPGANAPGLRVAEHCEEALHGLTHTGGARIL